MLTLILLALLGGAGALKIPAVRIVNVDRLHWVFGDFSPETFELKCPASQFFVKVIEVWSDAYTNLATEQPRLQAIRMSCATNELGPMVDLRVGAPNYGLFMNRESVSGYKGIRGLRVFEGDSYLVGMQALVELPEGVNPALYCNFRPSASFSTDTTTDFTQGSLGLCLMGWANTDLFCPDGMVITGLYGNGWPSGHGIPVLGIHCEYLECTLGTTFGGCSCPKGYGKSPLRSACAQCPLGTYKGSYLDGNTCKACTTGGGALGAQYSGAIGLTSDSCAYECKAGYEKPGVDICTKCTPGNYKSTIGNSPCVACTAGTFASISGKTVCTACTSGSTYQEQAGQSACLPCDTTRPLAGYYLGVCTTTTHSQPISCGLTTCGKGYRRSHDCPLLTSSLRRAPPTCVYCAVGTYQGASNSLLTTVSLVCCLYYWFPCTDHCLY